MSALAEVDTGPPASPPKIVRWLPLGAAIIAAAIAVGLYVVIAWAIPRGFDWTDESWAYSLIGSNRNTLGEVWGFQYLLHPVFDLLGQSVIAIRVLRLLCYFLLSLYFVAILYGLTRAKGWTLSMPSWILLLSVSQIGSFFAWSYPPRSIGYNEVASWLLQLGAGGLLLVVGGRLIGRPIVGSRVALVVWVGEGAVTLFLLAAKVTSGLVFGCVVILALVVSDPGARVLRRTLAVLAGAVVAFAIMLAGGLPVVAYVQNLFAVAFDDKARAASGHPVGTLLQAYQNDLEDSLVIIGASLAALVVVLVVVLLSARRPRRQFVRVILVVASVVAEMLLAFTVFTWVHLNAEFFALGYFAIFLGVASVLLVLAGLITGAVRARGTTTTRRPWRTWVVACFGIAILASAPFVSALGTNNPLSGELLFSSSIWASSLAFLLVAGGAWLVERGLIVAAVPLTFALFLLGASVIGVRHQIFLAPFRNLPLQTQTTPATSPALKGILLSKDDAEWTGWLSNEARILGAAPIPTISMVSPGALFVFNNSSYTDPWLLDITPVSFTSITASCRQNPSAKILILEPQPNAGNRPLFHHVTTALAKCGIAFPQDFVAVAKYRPDNPAGAITILKLKNTP